ncbi:ADP-ribosylglycohydrolase family protein [Paenibacillus roseipurpureus]|uniref:ADP-ribosylglycohydrolase family protein n=1 Tax=Paenibacillus roseopurpureus TaxID=2918901 RepID=A0AA96LRR1_9BACL|nr:ADP-ribosylglycohydrolase family protein [Paenibacillus sp. MBLB1832]WNR46815.1 ADP-ribosylglycohydrolase family protein [Paenibacillus sp. MBLB1832]
MLIPIHELRRSCEGRIRMLETQGHDVTGLKEKLDAIPAGYDAILKFGYELNEVPMRADFPYDEPNDLVAIHSERPEGAVDVIPGYLNELEIRDRVFGGVYGKMLGCILGKPLEMGWDLPLIQGYLEGAGAWPLNDFVPSFSPTQVTHLRRDCIESTKGHVTHVQSDDDINYMIMGLKVLEQFGPDFTTQDMAWMWRENIPYGWTWGPEHTRLCLLSCLWWGYGHIPQGKEWDQFVALFNDGEELIGAMIRGDTFGLVNPGRTAYAAELAWRDGRLTHGKTGLYAEMWVAAAVAAAFHETDPVKVIQAANAQLPKRSRYYEAMQEVLDWSVNEPDWLKVWSRINDKWGYLGFNGTFNESAAIVNSIVHGVDAYGQVDFEKVICMQVMQGWDCDSSGATAGCIAGVMAGYRNLPQKWLEPVRDTFHSTVAGEHDTRISKFAERVYQMNRIVRTAKPLKDTLNRENKGDSQNFTIKE